MSGLPPQANAIDKVTISAAQYRSDILLKEASGKASYLLSQFFSIHTKQDALRVSSLIETSLKDDSVHWECLRREGFMELKFFWEPESNRPAHHEVILDLQRRGLWIKPLSSAVQKWHARLGYHVSVWSHKLPLTQLELEWKRRELANELHEFKKQFRGQIGSGDGLSVKSALQVHSKDFLGMRKLLLSYLHDVMGTGMANCAVFRHQSGKHEHYLLQVYAVHRELGREYMYFFDISSLVQRGSDEHSDVGLLELGNWGLQQQRDIPN